MKASHTMYLRLSINNVDPYKFKGQLAYSMNITKVRFICLVCRVLCYVCLGTMSMQINLAATAILKGFSCRSVSLYSILVCVSVCV